MKTIGLIGGMTWESSLEYYRIINEIINRKLGGSYSANCILYSVNFDEIEKLQHEEKWDELTELMIKTAKKLEKSGAEFLIICANTMHKMAGDIQNYVNIPLLHITDVTAEKIIKKGLRKVGLLGTKFTMVEDFYKRRLKERFNIEVIVPDENEIEIVHAIIYKELGLGIKKRFSKEKFIEIIKNLVSKGAEGVILGCTEISFLIKQEDVNIPVFDTIVIHAKAAAEYALK